MTGHHFFGLMGIGLCCLSGGDAWAQTSPRRYESVIQEARVHQRDGRLAPAVVSFREAAALRPADGQTQCELGWAALHLGDLRLAERSFDEGLRLMGLDPAMPARSRLRAMCLYNRGRLAEQRGQLSQAISLYRQSLAARPRNAEVRRFLDAAIATASAPGRGRPSVAAMMTAAPSSSGTPGSTLATAPLVTSATTLSSVRGMFSGPRWIRIPAGSYVMGTAASSSDRHADERVHRAVITHDFELLTTEVSQHDFQNLMGFNPSRYEHCGPSCPVESVSWHEAAAYTNALSRLEGLEQCYRCRESSSVLTCEPTEEPSDCTGYRLPTESEWEWAARGAGGGVAGHELSEVAWFGENARADYAGGWQFQGRSYGPQPVGSNRPHARTLHDMFGNVWEWCHDWYGRYPASATNPSGPNNGSSRVIRGGSWASPAWWLRAASRDASPPRFQFGTIGFRVARTIR